MKIILSRKGFDSSAGGIPSPIFPDDRMVSLPIPSRADQRTMGDLQFGEHSLGKLVAKLSSNRLSSEQIIHLDPDIYESFVPRPAGWLPALGQTHIAQSHLAKQGIEAGDIFLFYGWFRRLEDTSIGLRYDRIAEHMHVIFGWLQVGEIWNTVDQRQELLRAQPALANHPYLAAPEHYTDKRNTLYVASKHLSIFGVEHRNLPGAGPLSHYNDRLRLSEPGQTRRIWRLPAWFYPTDGKPPLTYHNDLDKWTKQDEYVRLKTAGRGQEFVLNADAYPKARSWVAQLLGAK